VRRAVVNSSPLIYLSKIHALHLLTRVFDEVLIPQAVYGEVVSRGLERGYRDAVRVKEAVERGEILVQDAPQREVERILRNFPELDPGEAEVLALALRLGATVVVDERAARLAARSLGLEPHGTLYILIAATKRKVIDAEEALKMLDKLVNENFRVSAEVLRKARAELEALVKEG